MFLRKRLLLIIYISVACIITVCFLKTESKSARVTPPSLTLITSDSDHIVSAYAISSHNIDTHKRDSSTLLISDLQKKIHANTEKNNLKNILSIWIKKNPNAVMNYLLALRDDKFKTTVLALAMEIWHRHEENALNNWLLTAPISNTLDDAITMFCTFDKLSLGRSVQYARYINNINKQDTTTKALLKKWIKIDTASSIQWMVDDYESYQRFGVETYQVILDSDFNAALLSLPVLSSGDLSTSQNIIDIFIAKLYLSVDYENIDINSIKTSILTLPESDFKDMVLLSIAPVIFKIGDAYDGMVFIEAMPSGPSRDSLEYNLINLLVQRDVVMALEYVGQMGNDNRQDLHNTIITQWAQKDLVAANEWLKQSEIKSTDFIMPLVQTAINKKNAEIANEWLKKIDKDHDTSELKFRIAKLLYEESPQSGLEYLQGASQFSEEEKEKLFQYIENNQIH